MGQIAAHDQPNVLLPRVLWWRSQRCWSENIGSRQASCLGNDREVRIDDLLVGLAYLITFSLLLLSEFHPRSMHFPPGDDGDEILAPTDADAESLLWTDDEAQRGLTAGQAPLRTWTEPALRSDRMCWSLIGAAHTLAYELGLFGSFADSTVAASPRARRLERLLYVYISQTSGRLGLASMFRDIPREGDFAYLRQNLFRKCPRLPLSS